MADFSLREYREDDVPALCALWQKIFGDDARFISGFFRLLPETGICLVAEKDGRIAGMSSVLLALSLVRPGAGSEGCGYIYAVAAEPSCRHGGIGAALVRASAEAARLRGAGIICTLPAEDSLYAWYEKLLGLSCVLRRSSFDAPAKPIYPVIRIDSGEYLARREALLAGKIHLRPEPAAAGLARLFYETYGGGLFRCGDALCAAYSDKSTAFVKELIPAPGFQAREAAASVAACLGAEKAVFMLPSTDGKPYISALPGSIPPECVWNLSFD